MGFLRLGVHVLSAAVVCVLLSARPAFPAERVLVLLDYQVDRGLTCPSGADFQKAIRGHLRWDPFRSAAQRRILVRIHTNEGRLEGRVEWRDAKDQWEGERTFSASTDTCSELSRAMALATAIQIQLFAAIEEKTTAGSEQRPDALVKPPEPPVEAVVPPAPAPPAHQVVAAPGSAPPDRLRFRAPRLAFEATAGVIQDVSNAPLSIAPRLAIILGWPSGMSLRLTASGLGPSAEVKQFEGTAALTRFVASVELARFFRPDRRFQPFATGGLGVQRIHIHGTSAMTALAAAHDGQVLSGLLTAGGGVAFTLDSRFSLVVEADVLVFRPSIAVKIGSSPTAAELNGIAVLVSGGLLARF